MCKKFNIKEAVACNEISFDLQLHWMGFGRNVNTKV
jgi:hypothetical protein